MTDLAKLGDRIAARRCDLGLRQWDLADAVGRSRSQIANIEGGRVDPPTSLLIDIAYALGVPVGQLVGELAADWYRP